MMLPQAALRHKLAAGAGHSGWVFDMPPAAHGAESVNLTALRKILAWPTRYQQCALHVHVTPDRSSCRVSRGYMHSRSPVGETTSPIRTMIPVRADPCKRSQAHLAGPIRPRGHHALALNPIRRYDQCMAHFLFVDESGYDAGVSPYGVLAGVGVEDRDLWSLVKDIRVAELSYFGGIPYSGGERELKAKKLLKRKVFRQAAALASLPPDERAVLARQCLEQGDRAGARQITALAQAKIAYVMELMDLCAASAAKRLRALSIRLRHHQVQTICARTTPTFSNASSTILKTSDPPPTE